MCVVDSPRTPAVAARSCEAERSPGDPHDYNASCVFVFLWLHQCLYVFTACMLICF